MKRVLITGVFASGKTSLIKMLKDELESRKYKVRFFNEIARECPFTLNHQQSLMSTSWLVMGQIEKEIQAIDEEYDFLIYDRGLPDIIAHTNLILQEGADELLIYEMLESLGKASVGRFDYVFLSKRSDKFNIEADGLRVIDVTYQKKLEKIHINYLNKTDANYIILDEMNENRLDQILSMII